MGISLTTFGVAYTQNFDSLASTGTSAVVPEGWFLSEIGTAAAVNQQYTAGTGSSTTGDLYSFGAAGSTERALGTLQSGTNNPTFGTSFTNNTGSAITSLTIAYTGEQWRLGTSGRAVGDRLDFQVSSDATSITTGTWTNVDALDFNAPIITGTVGALNGNAAANRTSVTFTGLDLPTGMTFWFRWANFDATGADDGLAIDDFSITPHGTASATPAVNLSVSSSAGSETGTTTITVTATAASAVAGDQTVNLGVSGTGITFGDYTLSSSTISIADGQTTGSVTFTVVDDAFIEGTETAVLTISSPSAGITLGDTTTKSIVIADNDAPSVDLSVSTNSASETAATAVTVTVTSSSTVVTDQTVVLTVSGTGITAGDYTLSATTITIPAGSTIGTATFSVADDSVQEGTENAILTISSPSAGIALGATTTQAVAIADNDTLRIAGIQGATHISPYNGQSVFGIQGIVTAVDTNGFYMQDPLPDNNAATSEAILVFTNTAPTVQVGDAVQVSGRVTEYRPSNSVDNLTVTEIDSPTVTAWVGAPTTGIAPVVMGVDRSAPTQSINNDGSINVETGGDFDPVNEGIDFWESLEGMLVQAKNPVAVSPTLDTGELWLLPNNGAGATGLTARGGIGISATDYNPERLQIYGLTSGAQVPTVDVGAKLSDVTGVISYYGSNYELLVATSPTIVQASTLQREVTNLTPGTNLLTVAAFNVENLDPNDGAAKFNALASAVVNNLKKPDIISLEEVQDNNGATNNGVVAANITLQTLIDAIAAAGGPTYEYRQINPVNGTNGGEPGGNIRVAFLYNPARVSFVESSLTLIEPTNTAFNGSRKPLVGEFLFNGETVTVIGNHFNSKGGDDPLYGPMQPPVLSSEVQRNQQATIVKNYVNQLQAATPGAKIVVMGDLNDFEFSQPLSILESAQLNTLIETLPVNERYSYNYQGNAQTIDHMMVSNSLLTSLNGFDVVHINSEFAVQVSDHDPLVARFFIEPQGINVVGTAGRDTLVGTAGKDIITGGQGRDVLTGGASADQFVYNRILDAGDTITDFTPGSDKLVIAALLTSVGYTGTNPVADGYLSVVISGAGTNVQFDVDGNAGAGTPRALVTLTGVAVSDAAALLDPSLYVLAV